MKPFKPSLKQLVYLGAIGTVVFGLFCWFSPPKWLYWTGFKKDTEVSRTEKIIENGKEITVVIKDVSGKTLWDWLSVLGVPVSLAILGFLFQQQQQKIAESNQKEEVLQAYFDRLATLLIDKNLISIATKVEKSSNVIEEDQELLSASTDVIRARTLSILRRLEGDGKRKGSVVQFLTEAEFVSKLKLDLSGANLIGADLSNANLIKANLIKANLVGADFSNADLSSAYFYGNDLRAADLDNADLSNANFAGANFGMTNLSGANLSNAILIEIDLRTAQNLTLEQVAKAKLCRTKLPSSMQIDLNRDCKELGIELI